MRVDSSRSTSGIVSPSGKSSFWLRRRTDTRSGIPEVFWIVRGIVPSRAASVRVNVSGVLTWLLTTSIVETAAATCSWRRAALRSAATATSSWRASGSTLGLSRPTRPT